MRQAIVTSVGAFMIFAVLIPLAHAIKINVAEIRQGAVVVHGNQAASSADVTWEGQLVTQTNSGGVFSFSTAVLPQDCVGDLSDGATTIQVIVSGCSQMIVQGGGLLATGQTTAFPADTDDGIAGPVPVPDDGTLQLGAPLHYIDNGDGTVTDTLTGLMWEKKCDGNSPECPETHLHALNFCADVDCNSPVWSLGQFTGVLKTIWDWLNLVNSEGGTGFAGYSDWRIPNVRELESIKDYGRPEGINPIFGPSECTFWSSTSRPDGVFAYLVEFPGGTFAESYGFTGCVRAVRGGR
jgi:hypothetical protein